MDDGEPSNTLTVKQAQGDESYMCEATSTMFEDSDTYDKEINLRVFGMFKRHEIHIFMKFV